MDFYRLKQPGSEWLPRQGDAAQANKTAKVGWEKIEVPTSSKPKMLEWLNANARDGAIPLVVAAADEPVQPPRSGKEEHCPKCKFTPRQADAYVATIKRGMTMEGIKQFIEERTGWELSTVVESITARLIELAKEATGKK